MEAFLWPIPVPRPCASWSQQLERPPPRPAATWPRPPSGTVGESPAECLGCSAPPWARAGSLGTAAAAEGDAWARSPPRGPRVPGRLAAGRPVGLRTRLPLRRGDGGAGGRGLPGGSAPLPGAAAVGGTPGAVPAEHRALQSRPALLRRAQPACAGAGREEGADPLQEVRGARKRGRGGPGRARSRELRRSAGFPAARVACLQSKTNFVERISWGQQSWGLGVGLVHWGGLLAGTQWDLAGRWPVKKGGAPRPWFAHIQRLLSQPPDSWCPLQPRACLLHYLSSFRSHLWGRHAEYIFYTRLFFFLSFSF